jgi:hypothetical protein
MTPESPHCDLTVERRSATVWSTPRTEPVREASRLYRLLPVLVSVWISVDGHDSAVVAGERSRKGVAGLPAEVDPFAFFGPVLLAAADPCPGCGSGELLALGIRGGSRVFSRLHRGLDAARLIPYHLAAEIGGVPNRGLARPAGLVLGTLEGELGVPVQVERMLWAGEDGRPLGWSRITTEMGGGRHHALLDPANAWFGFDRPPGAEPWQRWLTIDAEDRDRELLRTRLHDDYDAIVVRRLHVAEGKALRDLELIS